MLDMARSMTFHREKSCILFRLKRMPIFKTLIYVESGEFHGKKPQTDRKMDFGQFLFNARSAVRNTMLDFGFFFHKRVYMMLDMMHV